MKTPRGTARAAKRAGCAWMFDACPGCNRLGPRPAPGLCGDCSIRYEDLELKHLGDPTKGTGIYAGVK